MGGPAPWADLPISARRLCVDDVRNALARAGAAQRSPLESTMSRAAAVLVPLYDHDGEVHVVLTRRAWHLRAHRGEVSFPGGGRDPGEELADTARREAWEEVALDPSTVEMIGELDHLSTFTSGSWIVPYVAALPDRPALTGAPAEVEAVLHVPLSELMDDETFHEERWDIFDSTRSIYFFDIAGDTIWGATAAMLRQLLGLATGTVDRGQLGHP